MKKAPRQHLMLLFFKKKRTSSKAMDFCRNIHMYIQAKKKIWKKQSRETDNSDHFWERKYGRGDLNFIYIA